MNEPGISPQGQAKDQSLWHHAPGWRTLTVAASLLTLVAVGLPTLLPQEGSPALQPALPAPGRVSIAPTANPPQMAPPTLSSSAPHFPTPNLRVPSVAAPAKISPNSQTTTALQIPPPPTSARQLSLTSASQASPPAASQSTAPQIPAPPTSAQQLSLASAPQPPAQAVSQSTAPVCNMTRQDATPRLIGLGTIVGFEDHAMSLARIRVTEANVRGLIDPDYIENQRVIVRSGSGQEGVFIVPKGMSVQIGDRVILQDGYRNFALPCNYIPVQIASDIGPPPKPTSPPK
jgi:hypothetical protein